VSVGPLYRGRFKSLPVECDQHLSTILRYIQRNPLRASLVRHAINWRWGSASIRAQGPAEMRQLLSPWPIEVRRDWNRWVDQPQTPAEEDAIRTAIRRSRPFGADAWVKKTAMKLDLKQTLRPRGRPRNEP
jgi:REP-associated tyrosine transposase